MEIAVTLLSKYTFQKVFISLVRCHQQRLIRMSVSRLQKEVDELKTNPYYEKYAEKIATLQKTSPEEFLSRIEQQKEKSAKSTAAKERSVSTRFLHFSPVEKGTHINAILFNSFMN